MQPPVSITPSGDKVIDLTVKHKGEGARLDQYLVSAFPGYSRSVVQKVIDAGMVHVNDGTINDDPLIAFGGEKASGVGRLNGKWALEEFTTLKWISVQHKQRHYPFEIVTQAS